MKPKVGGYETKVTLTLPLLDGRGQERRTAQGAGAVKRAKREPPWSWSEGYSGKDVPLAQLSVEERATKIGQCLQKLNEGGLVLSDEELVNGFTRLMERTKRREVDGMGGEEALRLAIAEQLYDEHPNPQWLLKLAALALVGQYKPKFKAERRQEEAVRKREKERQLERGWIDCVAEMLRNQGVRNYRSRAMQMYAEGTGVKIGAIKQRHRRERRRRERRKQGGTFFRKFSTEL